jgi:hypothetical protein
MKTIGLNSNHTLNGEWWLPENPDVRRGGDLTIANAKGKLKLTDSFLPLPEDLPFGSQSWESDIIHGLLREMGLVTLVNSRVSSGFVFNRGHTAQPTSITPKYLALGEHIRKNQQYTSMSFRVPALDAWLAESMIEQSYYFDSDDESCLGSEYRISTKKESVIRINELQTEFKFTSAAENKSESANRLEIETSSWLIINPDEPQTFDWFLEKKNVVLSFITILCGLHFQADCIVAYFNENDEKRSCELVEELSRPYRSVSLAREDFFVLKSDLTDQLNGFLQKWAEVYRKFDQACQLAVSVITTEAPWKHLEFLSLMQAIEGFHRHKHSGNYTSEGDYEVIKKEIINSFPRGLSTDHREALKAKIKFGNEISLRKRFKDLLDDLPAELAVPLFGPSKKTPQRWIDTRNYYTHWDANSRENILNHLELYAATLILQLFLIVLYLREANVPDHIIKQALVNNQREHSRRLIFARQQYGTAFT